GSTLGSIINRVFLAAVTSTVVLRLGVFLAWIFRGEELAKRKALASARSILDAQIPAIAEALDRNSTDAVQMRLSLLFATHREHDFAGIVLNRDKQMLASTNFDLADLSHLTAQVDPIEVASGSRVYVG